MYERPPGVRARFHDTSPAPLNKAEFGTRTRRQEVVSNSRSNPNLATMPSFFLYIRTGLDKSALSALNRSVTRPKRPIPFLPLARGDQAPPLLKVVLPKRLLGSGPLRGAEAQHAVQQQAALRHGADELV